MELESITNIKTQYRNLLSNDPAYNQIISGLIQKRKDEPILQICPIGAEDDLSYQEEQRQMSEILLDMHAVDYGIRELKNVIQDTIQSLNTSIETITSSIAKQREQAEDISIICGAQSAYSMIVPVYTDYFPDTAAETIGNKTLGAMPIAINQIEYDIVNVAGNGYSGNAFVYNDHVFINTLEDRSIVSYVMDHNHATAYEYSRLLTKVKQEAVGGIINYDDKPVECTFLLHAEEPVCKAILQIDEEKVVIQKIEISDDGLNFNTVSTEPIYINDTKQMYEHCHYIYGTPVLCFPYASFIRITLSCDTVTNDTIAIQEEAQDDIAPIAIYQNTYRKKITIREIELYNAEYEACTIISDEILTDCAIDKISLFTSEYIPNHFPEASYIEYSLLLNGQEYPIVPVNSEQEGVSIIKYSEETTSENTNTTLIHETIKSARIKITIRPYTDKETPYVSNLKLCVGKNTGDIYV